MNAKAALTALVAYAMFSTHDVVVKYLGTTFSPMQIVFFASLFSFPMFSVMLVRDPSHGNLRPVHPWWVALRSALMVLGPTLAFFAITMLPLAQVYPILFASPLLITIFAIPILGEKVGIPRLLAVLIGLGGVLVVIRPGTDPLSLGHVAALLAAVAGALQSVIVRKIGREERRVVLMLYPLLISFVVMGLAMTANYQPMSLLDLAATAFVALFGFIAALLLVFAYTHGEAAVVAPMHYSQILWALLFGAILFDESVDATTLLGSAIIVASGLFIILREAIGGTSEQTPVLRTRSRGFSPGSFRVSTALKRPKNNKTK